MTIAEAARALLAELEADDIPAPLTVRFTLATTLADLARIAGEPLPAAVAAALAEEDAALPLPGPGFDAAFAARLLTAGPDAFGRLRAAEAHRGYVAD